MFSTSCNKEEIVKVISGEGDSNISIDSNQTVNTKSSVKSGEEMFKEIILLEGDDIISKIPEYDMTITQMNNSLNSEERKAKSDFSLRIINLITTLDPNYFSHFKSVMISDDHYLINNELENASKILLSVVQSIPNDPTYTENAMIITDRSSHYDFSNQLEVDEFSAEVKRLIGNDMDNQDGFFALAAVAVVAVGVWSVVASVNVVAAATVMVYAAALFWGPINNGNSGSLKNEKVVNSIVSNY